MKYLQLFNEVKTFKKKQVKVRDYPDPAKKVTMWGKSDKSKYKLGDKVYIINNDRVGCDLKKVTMF